MCLCGFFGYILGARGFILRKSEFCLIAGYIFSKRCARIGGF